MSKYQNYNPPSAVDIAIIVDDGERNPDDCQILLIERKNEPLGWALPGGFQEMGDTLEHTAAKELEEETGLWLPEEAFEMISVCSDPKRDPRGHVNSVLFLSVVPEEIEVRGGDDAVNARWFKLSELPEEIALGHADFIKTAFFAAFPEEEHDSFDSDFVSDPNYGGTF